MTMKGPGKVTRLSQALLKAAKTPQAKRLPISVLARDKLIVPRGSYLNGHPLRAMFEYAGRRAQHNAQVAAFSLAMARQHGLDLRLLTLEKVAYQVGSGALTHPALHITDGMPTYEGQPLQLKLWELGLESESLWLTFMCAETTTVPEAYLPIWDTKGLDTRTVNLRLDKPSENQMRKSWDTYINNDVSWEAFVASYKQAREHAVSQAVAEFIGKGGDVDLGQAYEAGTNRGLAALTGEVLRGQIEQGWGIAVDRDGP